MPDQDYNWLTDESGERTMIKFKQMDLSQYPSDSPEPKGTPGPHKQYQWRMVGKTVLRALEPGVALGHGM